LHTHFSLLFGNAANLWWSERIPAKIVKAAATILSQEYHKWIQWQCAKCFKVTLERQPHSGHQLETSLATEYATAVIVHSRKCYEYARDLLNSHAPSYFITGVGRFETQSIMR
jgi:hypothetical protein